MKKLSVFLAAVMTSSLASAGAVQDMPVEVSEPGMLGLFAAGAAALFIVRKFRK
jgi:hypothetical protein